MKFSGERMMIGVMSGWIANQSITTFTTVSWALIGITWAVLAFMGDRNE